jgi:SAM-dependent methyltransferase
MKAALAPDFSTVTEQPWQGATRMQMEMLRTRYAWAASHAAQRDVLEVACGAGLGLGWLALSARSVEAGDIHEGNCRLAQATYHGEPAIRIRRMDALDLPFEDASFDLVLLFEALYYLSDPDRFFRQARRVLRPGGVLLISTVNREWGGFHPSPFHTRYFSATELKPALERAGFEARLLAGFPERRAPRGGLRNALRRAASGLRNALRRSAGGLRCIPRSMRGKAFLKRIFYGPLDRIPGRLEPGTSGLGPLIAVDPWAGLPRYRTLYAEAQKTTP